MKRLLYLVYFLAFSSYALPAHAACSANEDGNPGQEGEIEYFTTDRVFRYCDGSDNWIDISYGDQPYKLNASDAGAGDYFADEVSVYGNYAIMGARSDDDTTPNSGSAYIFNLTDGSQLYKLTASDPGNNDQFGLDVFISENYAVTGAYWNDDDGSNSGSAYVFDLSDGTQLYKLTASDAGAEDYFGRDVGAFGDYAIFSSQNDDDVASDAGAAYVFDLSDGSELYKLTASDGAADDLFGNAVAISANYALVGAYRDDDNGLESGSAYVFDLSDGSQLYKLTATDGAEDDAFGGSVALTDDYAVIGAYDDDDNGNNSGSVYIFDMSDGSQLYKLTASDGAANDSFGEELSVSGNYVAIGAPDDDDDAIGTGSVYIFDLTDGSQLFKIAANDRALSDDFGAGVGIYGTTLVVGAPDENFTGSAYVFDIAAIASNCSNEGAISYDTDNDVLVWCNSYNNYYAGEPNSADVGGCDGQDEGAMNYDTSDDTYYFCNGNAWVPIPGAASGDTTPDGFAVPDYNSPFFCNPPEAVYSSVVQVTGIDTAVTVTITGGTAPTKEFRTCSNSDCSSVIRALGSADTTISNNEYIQLSADGLSANSSYSFEFQIGTETYTWSITTGNMVPC